MSKQESETNDMVEIDMVEMMNDSSDFQKMTCSVFSTMKQWLEDNSDLIFTGLNHSDWYDNPLTMENDAGEKIDCYVCREDDHKVTFTIYLSTDENPDMNSKDDTTFRFVVDMKAREFTMKIAKPFV